MIIQGSDCGWIVKQINYAGKYWVSARFDTLRELSDWMMSKGFFIFAR